MTRKTLIAVGVLVLIVLGFYAVLNRAQVGNEVDNERNVFTTARYNLTFEIPDRYKIMEFDDESSNRHVIVLFREEDNQIPEDSEGPPAITIDIFQEPGTQNLESWITQNNISNFSLLRGDVTERTVDNTRALAYSWDGLYLGRSVVFTHGDNLYLVSGSYLDTRDPIYTDFDAVVDSIELR
jgi:hypothetical protein